MPFQPDGTWTGERLDDNTAWRVTPGTVLHHMIDWATLRGFWNGLVTRRLQAQLVRYLAIVRCDAAQPAQLVQAILDRKFHEVSGKDQGKLSGAICSQRYNLFEGPNSQFRPDHSPDLNPDTKSRKEIRQITGIACRTTVELRKAAGCLSFDFPIVAPPHGERAWTLWRAFELMTAFIGGGAADGCLNLLESVAHLNVIPAYDVNWFALQQPLFWRLNSPQERRQFFDACIQTGWNTDGNQVYQRLYGEEPATT